MVLADHVLHASAQIPYQIFVRSVVGNLLSVFDLILHVFGILKWNLCRRAMSNDCGAILGILVWCFCIGTRCWISPLRLETKPGPGTTLWCWCGVPKDLGSVWINGHPKTGRVCYPTVPFLPERLSEVLQNELWPIVDTSRLT